MIQLNLHAKGIFDSCVAVCKVGEHFAEKWGGIRLVAWRRHTLDLDGYLQDVDEMSINGDVDEEQYSDQKA